MRALSLERTGNRSPWNEFHKEFDKLFFGNGYLTSEDSTYWSPQIDYQELKNKYIVNIEVPGISRDKIKIEYFDDLITISGEKKIKEEKEGFYSERSYGKFIRSFSLPKGTDTDKIEADLENGVLTLAIPKVEAKKPKEIKIAESKGLLSKLLGDGKQDPAA